MSNSFASACLVARAAIDAASGYHAADHVCQSVWLWLMSQASAALRRSVIKPLPRTHMNATGRCRGAELTLQDWAAADAAHPEAEDPSDLMDQPGEVDSNPGCSTGFRSANIKLMAAASQHAADRR